jgi:2-isopropylmalate synthase
MPYLPIDPKDLGRSYDAVIRVNSQSGKGGIAYLLESSYGVVLPRRLQIEFSQIVQQHTDEHGTEISADQIWELFKQTYIYTEQKYYQVKNYHLSDHNGRQAVQFEVLAGGEVRHLTGEGNGPISAILDAIALPIDVLNYEEKSIGHGANAKALAMIELQIQGQPISGFGVGIHDNIVTASIEAILACINRMIEKGAIETDQVTETA